MCRAATAGVVSAIAQPALPRAARLTIHRTAADAGTVRSNLHLGPLQKARFGRGEAVAGHRRL
eukprot:9723681-Alexandrium_andersonii.AAC.1